jgi:beta-lactamase class A
MQNHLNRRAFLGSVGASLAATACLAHASNPEQPAATAPARPPAERDLFREIEAEIGGRVGAFALDTASGATLAHRADERFALASTFKWLLSAALLARVDSGQVSLDRELTFGPDDVLEYAPVVRENLARGKLSVAELAIAAVEQSDNSAGNLLLALLGGPASVTQFARGLGDRVTRLDRNEPTLNTNLPNDPRDTTTPRAMALDLRAVVAQRGVLSEASRARLTDWLETCRTGADRLRAGFPATWRLAHKTGSGEHNAINDVGVAWPPERAPIIIAVYLSESAAPLAALAAAHADIARIVVREFG